MLAWNVRRPLGDYLRECGNRMGLSEWAFYLNWHMSPEDSGNCQEHEQVAARTRVTYGRLMATFEFNDNVRDSDPFVLRQTVCHELMHCHAGHMQSMLENEFHREVGILEWDPLWAGWLRQFELMIDNVATSWSDHLPIIDWKSSLGKRPKKKFERAALSDRWASTYIGKGRPEQYAHIPLFAKWADYDTIRREPVLADE